jgi:hypothetical protein
MAKRYIRLPSLSGYLDASPALSITPSHALIAALDQLAKRPPAIRAAHLAYFPAANAGRLQTELEVMPKDPLYLLELLFGKKLS